MTAVIRCMPKRQITALYGRKRYKTVVYVAIYGRLRSYQVVVIGEHNHLSDPDALEIKLFRDKLKQRAVHETTAISKIYEEEVVKSQFSIQVLANLPLAREIQPGLAHARRLLTPVLPLSSLFDIPDSY
ncbi:unnamed protein product, partial [Rotaria magnacalcarata]